VHTSTLFVCVTIEGGVVAQWAGRGKHDRRIESSGKFINGTNVLRVLMPGKQHVQSSGVKVSKLLRVES